jgi:type VI secretion system (T6SS) effector TldE1-like protein
MSTSACYDFAAHRRSTRKAVPHAKFGSAVVASLMLGCAWTVYSNVFGASVYPTLSSTNFDLPVVKRSSSIAVRSPATIIDNVFAALPEPAPVISAPATVPSGPSLSFEDRFAAAAPQSQPPQQVQAPQQVAQAPQPAEAQKPVEAPKLVAASKPQEAPKPQVVASLPPPPDRQATASTARPADAKPAKSAGDTVRDMAQRAKAAVMSIASSEKQTVVEKLWGKPQPRGPSLLSFASADASITGSLGPSQNPALAGNTPRYDQSTAVYDITAHMVYLPDGSKLEAHSGLGSRLDDPRYVRERMYGATPPHLYDLEPRESLFHGVAALRLKPVGGEETIFGRSGLLAHTYMLGPNGDSNGCVSFRDYDAFLKAYRYGGIKRLAVVDKID